MMGDVADLQLDPHDPIVVRAATPDDYDAVADLTVAVYVGEGYVPATSEYAEILARTAHRAAATDVLVAVDAGCVVGSLTIARPPSPFAPIAQADEIEFRMLAVRRSARGLGIGTRLVRHVLDLAAEEGYRAVVISTDDAMVDARRIYLELGFVHVPERDWSPMPGVALTVLECVVSRERLR